MTSDSGIIDRPVFFIGMPRSGTTLIFESFARNSQLGWFSYNFARFPSFPPIALLSRLCDFSPAFRKAVTRSRQKNRWIESLRDGPSEAYSVWKRCCGEKFLYDFLLAQDASPAERRCTRRTIASTLRWQGKDRFAAKITGPARMGFLMSILPDVQFVHVVRDGRAVVNSLLRVDFWRNSFRINQPAWSGGLDSSDEKILNCFAHSPLALAAIQWRNMIDRCQQERDRHQPRVYLEVRYEDFLEHPVSTMEKICAATKIEFSDSCRKWLLKSKAIRPNPVNLRDCFSAADLEILDRIMGDTLEEFGYSRKLQGSQ
jgi:Sulfotransferase family